MSPRKTDRDIQFKLSIRANPFPIAAMSTIPSLAGPGRVASLHLHPAESGAPLLSVASVEVVADKGIRDTPRHFGRQNSSGEPSRRQVTLIEREQIAEHAATLGLQTIAPGVVRSNIETTGINLIELVGQHVEIGEALLHLYEPRRPCHQMEAIHPGLQALMKNNRQGVLATVVRSGRIRVGDTVQFLHVPAGAKI